MNKKIKIMAICTALLLVAVILVAVLAPRAFAAELTSAGAEATVQTIDLTGAVNSVIALLAALISAYVVPYLKKKIGAEKLDQLRTWCAIAVQAAEQLKSTGIITDKKQYVIDYLESKGFTVDDALVEATVNKLFGKTSTAEINEEARG